MIRRRSFTAAEFREIRELIRDKEYADEAGKKMIRQRLRQHYGFYVDIFKNDYPIFTARGLEDLLRLGTITVVDQQAADEREALDGTERRAVSR